MKIPQRKVNRVISFSGGRTSGLMLRREIDKAGGIERFNELFIVCFCNTGKERDETLDFVHEVETRWSVPIVWLEYHRVPANTIDPNVFPTETRRKNHIKIGSELTHWFKIVTYETASRNGEPFDCFLTSVSALPTVVGRSCSSQLKIRTAMRYCFSLGWTEFDCYIGIRSDESHRATQIAATCEKFLHPRFPMVEDSLTVFDVTKFWNESYFDLQLKNYEGNCDLCFLKSVWKRKRIMRDNPERAKWWIQKETEKHLPGHNQPSTFRKGETYEGVLIDALHPELDFDAQDDQDIPCSCAERGFESEECEL